MRQINDQVLSGLDSSDVTGKTLDSNQMINMSFHCVVSDATAAGTFKLQCSNDISQIPPGQGNFQPTNWIDIPNMSVTMTPNQLQSILQLEEVAFRWVRAIWTSTTPGTGTITVNRFGEGV